MISFLIKHKKSILIITLACFIGSLAYVGIGSFRSGVLSSNAAMVGSAPITYRTLYKVAEAQTRTLQKNGVDVDEEMRNYLKQQVLQGLIGEEILNQSAREFGMAVSNYEIASEIQSAPFFSQNGKFDRTAYEQVVKHQLGMTPAEFEDQLARGKMQERFRLALFSIYKLTPEEVRFAYQTQNGNLNNFEQNKKDFEKQLFETKMETAQKAFLDDFNNRVEVKILLKEQA